MRDMTKWFSGKPKETSCVLIKIAQYDNKVCPNHHFRTS